MTRSRRPCASRRGMTLIEAMVAVAVLGIGLTALLGMMDWVSRATTNLRFEAAATDAYARLAAQIRDAECEFDAADPTVLTQQDPGLAVQNVWIGDGGPIGGSLIRAVGTSGVELPDSAPAIRVEYMVRPNTSGALLGAFDGAWQQTSLQVDVRIRQIMRDPAKDDPARTDGYWIKVYPVQKRCNPRTQATRRGGYLP